MKEYLIIISWILAIYLSVTSFKRSEIYRAKDKIVDRLDKLQDWLVKEIKSIKDDSDRGKSLPLIENYSSSKTTQIELRVTQFNNYVSKEVLDPNYLAEIRDIDFFTTDESLLLKNINTSFSNVIEKVEIDFEKHTKNGVLHQLSTHSKDISTILFVLLSILVLLEILENFFG